MKETRGWWNEFRWRIKKFWYGLHGYSGIRLSPEHQQFIIEKTLGDEGAKAYVNDVPRNKCPDEYKDSALESHWVKGWDSAYRSDLEE